MTTYKYTLVLRRYSCGCTTGHHDLTVDCPHFKALRSAGNYAGCEKHRATGTYIEENVPVTMKFSSVDKSSIAGKEETPQELLARMCPNRGKAS